MEPDDNFGKDALPEDARTRNARAPADALVARLRAAGCVFAEEEAAILSEAAACAADLERMTLRRIAGEPLEYIVGWVDFAGLRIPVDSGVFVPRQRTEFLVREAVRLSGESAAAGAERGPAAQSGSEAQPASRARAASGAQTAQSASGSPVVVDLCCGTGALALAFATAVPSASVWAADVDPTAVANARRNLPAGRVFEGDLFDALPPQLRGRIDVLLCNTPYVPTEAIALMPPEAREHEHRVALDGGSDGLDLQRRVAAAALDWLAPGGILLVETGEEQAATSAGIFASAGLIPGILTSEEFFATVVIGTRPVQR